MEKTPARRFKNICVFAGSSPGKNNDFVDAAHTLGCILAEKKINLIYGGGSMGLNGCVATAAHIGGSKVFGVTPTFLNVRVGRTVGTEIEVCSMHSRMKNMLMAAEAFIALPGGFGTLENMFQILSWAQMHIHKKPIGLLNVNGFYDGLLSFLDHAVEQKFLSPSARRTLISAPTPYQLMEQLQSFISDCEPVQVEQEEPDKTKQILDLTLRL